MSGPLGFTTRFLTRRGALIDDLAAGALEVLLPFELATELGLKEHAILTEVPTPEAIHIGYGSILLERLVAATASQIPFVTAKAIIAPVRTSQARAAAEAFVFRNGVFSVGEPALAQATRLLAHAAFVLHGDERREGLCSATTSLHTLGIVAGFEEAITGALEETTVTLPNNLLGPRVARVCLAACSSKASEAAQGFRESMRRRFERDQERLENYFADLLSELDKRGSRGKTDITSLQEKRGVIERERNAKLEGLSARFVMKVEVRPIAFLLIEAPTYRISLELRRRKMSRTLEVEYDCATRKLVAPACEGCGLPAPNPAACDEAVHLLCEKCAPKSEGRVTCAACRGRASPGH